MNKQQRIHQAIVQLSNQLHSNGVETTEVNRLVEIQFKDYFKDCVICGKKHFSQYKYCSKACEAVYKKKDNNEL